MEFKTATIATNAIYNTTYNGYVDTSGGTITGTFPNTVTTESIPTQYLTTTGDGLVYTNPNVFTLPNGGLNGQYFTFPAIPDLDALQEGTFDIKGGKIIIKKIKVTQEQIDESEDTFEGKSSKEDEGSIEDRKELEYFCASEEREI